MDESPDIRLRRLSPDDAPAIAAALSDGRVARTTATIPERYSLADAMSWLAVVLEPRPRSEQWAIERNGALVGVVALQLLGPTQANVSYWIDPILTPPR